MVRLTVQFQAISLHTAPPPQYFMPVPVRPMPMHMTATPVTRGGNILPELVLGDEGEEDLEEGADQGGTEHLAVRVVSIHAVGFHVVDGVLEDGEEGERGAKHGEHAGAEHIWSSGDLELEAVDDGEHAGEDEGRRDGVLHKINVGKSEAVDAEPHGDEGRGDETCG